MIKKFKAPITQDLAENFLIEVSSVLNRDGVLIIEDLIDPELLSQLKNKMEFDLNNFLSQKKCIGGGLLIGHINARPPMSNSYIYQEIICNEVLHKITSFILKADSINLDYSANINLPGSTRQSFHSDDNEYKFDFLMVSIPLGNVNATNGSTEFITTTQFCRFNKKYANRMINEHADTSNGSIILWRPSTWHRGSYNFSNIPRIMLNLKHTSKDSKTYKNSIPLELDKITVDNNDKILKYINLVSSKNINNDSIFTPNYFNSGIKGFCKEIVYKYYTKSYDKLATI
jgi:hypothetical protein